MIVRDEANALFSFILSVAVKSVVLYSVLQQGREFVYGNMLSKIDEYFPESVIAIANIYVTWCM